MQGSGTAATGTVSREDLAAIAAQAVLAPSGHNTQPWQFRLHPSGIDVLPDHSRRLAVVDADDHALYISLGAALETLLIAAGARGLHGRVHYFPDGADLLHVQLEPGGAYEYVALSEWLAIRQSNRRRYDGRRIPSVHLARLQQMAVQEGVYTQLFGTPAERATITPFVEDGAREQLRDPAFVAELLEWVRFSRREVKSRQDGLPGPAFGMPHVPRWLGAPLMKLLLRPETQAADVRKAIASSSALLLFIAARHDREHWVKLGQSFQRAALAATCLGIQHAHLNMPCEVPAVRARLRAALELGSAEPLLLIRLGYAPPTARSPRRPLDAVLRER